MGECEEKLKEYLKRNNGKKLEELEKGLVLFEDCYEPIQVVPILVPHGHIKYNNNFMRV